MSPRAISGTARLPGCDIEVSASQAGSSSINLQSRNAHGGRSCSINLQCGKAKVRKSDVEDDAFAAERGIELGGWMWELSPAGRAALEASHDR